MYTNYLLFFSVTTLLHLLNAFANFDFETGDLIDLYSPLTRQVFPYTIRSVSNDGTSGSVHLNEDIYMVTETMIHIRKRIDLLLNVKDAEKNRRQLILTELLKTECSDLEVDDVMVCFKMFSKLRMYLNCVHYNRL